MSELAEQDRLAKRGWAAPGGAHDRLVGSMKFVLPAVIGVLLAFLLLSPLGKKAEISFLLDKNKVDVARERLKVKGAQYRGVDEEGRPFVIETESGLQARSSDPRVDLTGMSARIELDDGPAVLRADKGRYDMDRQRLEVLGPLLFTTAGGYRLQTGDIALDMATKTLTGEGGVHGQMPLGRFTARTMKADLKARTVQLGGRARLRIEQGAM